MSARGKRRPHVLWIGTDEQHRQTVGAYGSVNCETATLDRLASQGLVFDNAFSPIAVCAPARAAMLTGRLPSEGSVISNNRMEFTVPFLDTNREAPLATWVPELIASGYRCSHVGKWHVVPVEDDRPSKFGFEGPDWGGYGKTWQEPDFQAYRQRLGLTPQPELEEVLPALHPISSPFSPLSARLAGPVEGSLPHFVAETAIDELRRLASGCDSVDNPFFLRCEFWGPHIPCWVAEPYYSQYEPSELILPENFNVLGENKPEVVGSIPICSTALSRCSTPHLQKIHFSLWRNMAQHVHSSQFSEGGLVLGEGNLCYRPFTPSFEPSILKRTLDHLRHPNQG